MEELKKRAVRICEKAKNDSEVRELLKQLVCGEISKREFVELGEKLYHLEDQS